MNTDAARGWRTGYRQAHLDKLADRFVAHPVSTCSKGWALSVAPAVVLPLNAEPADLVNAVIASLEKSNDAWPPPTWLDEDPRLLFRALGIKSWREYDPIATLSINQSIKSSVIRLEPMKRQGAGHGPVGKRSIRVAAGASVDELASKLAQALAKSEAAYRPRRRRRS